MGILINKREPLQHFPAHMWKSSRLPLGTIKGKSSLATNSAAVSARNEMCNNKDSCSRLGHARACSATGTCHSSAAEQSRQRPLDVCHPLRAYVWIHALIDRYSIGYIEELVMFSTRRSLQLSLFPGTSLRRKVNQKHLAFLVYFCLLIRCDFPVSSCHSSTYKWSRIITSTQVFMD